MTGVSLVTYYFIGQYRENEFMQQLEQKAFTIADILFQSNETGVGFVDEIEKNTKNDFHEERILVFNEKHKLIYNSGSNLPVEYSEAMLSKVEKNKAFRKQFPEYEIFAKSYEEKGKKLIVMISAYDKYGMATLNRMQYILLFSTVLGISFLIFFSFIIVEKSLLPIYLLNDEMEDITENNLRKEIAFQSRNNDEVTRLSTSYNKMLLRLADAFENQKLFVQHASHELRTPLSVMLLELDNALVSADDVSKPVLISLKEELLKLIDLTNSLLLLSKLANERKGVTALAEVRIDEVLFDIAEEVMSHDSKNKIKIELNGFENEEMLHVNGNPILLKIMFRNLIENACKYAQDNTAIIRITLHTSKLAIHISNDGQTIAISEQPQIFNPLFRASNSVESKGFGVGLSIVKRIAEYHRAAVDYTINEKGENQFSVLF
ncbi:MAG: HAMP domain-containing sensor histidine kinase [Chitinophagales bacterium]